MSHIAVVVGARPNFMKAAPVLAALEGKATCSLVHTGQHYDELMSDVFFRDLELPAPDVNLGVGSSSHARQTAEVLVAFADYLQSSKPDVVLVVGDVNSTLAAALAAAKLQIPVGHIEAGLRSNDWTMPEEINRVLTDRLSRWLFTHSPEADENLAREGLAPSSVHLVGNVMIDTLLRLLPKARDRFDEVKRVLDLPERFALLTLHRPANLERTVLAGIIDGIEQIALEVPVIFPAHPRTKSALADLEGPASSNLRTVEPLGYLDFLALMDQAALVLTDSGGLQEETSALGVPCVTIRDNTERPITISLGTNTLAGTRPDAIVRAVKSTLDLPRREIQVPLWDGRAGERLAAVLLRDLDGKS